MPTIDFHYLLPSPPCRAVMILAKELNIELNLINVDLMTGAHMTPEFQKLNPRKTVPAIVDNGFILGDSRAIMTYLVNQYSPGNKLYPKDPKKRAEIDRVLYLTAELFERFRPLSGPVIQTGAWPIPEEGKEKYRELLAALELLSAGRKFLAGDEMSIADISYICDYTVLREVFKIDTTAVAPGIAAWAERMKKALPEYDELITKPIAGFNEFIEGKVGHKLE